jgi:hypothetical protein
MGCWLLIGLCGDGEGQLDGIWEQPDETQGQLDGRRVVEETWRRREKGKG